MAFRAARSIRPPPAQARPRAWGSMPRAGRTSRASARVSPNRRSRARRKSSLAEELSGPRRNNEFFPRGRDTRYADGRASDRTRRRRMGRLNIRRPGNGRVGDMRARELAETKVVLQRALEERRATSEILRAISASPADTRPVFEVVLDNAVRLCEGELGGVFLRDGDVWSVQAYKGDDPSAWAGFQRVQAGPHTGLGNLVVSGKPIHISDPQADADAKVGEPLRVLTLEALGARTFFAVPLVKDGTVIGAIVIYRREVRPFTDEQIRLVTTFADQAVIAVENVRLFNETKEAL